MTWKIDLLRGETADSFVRDERQRRAWAELARRDSKSTYYQEPDFVVPWYRTYADVYEPVILLGLSSQGDILGLMALAWDPSGQRIVHAGANNAWYHGWIADSEIDRAFPARCAEAVFREFPIERWTWSYLPAEASATWTGELRKSPAVARVRDLAAPVWDLSDDTLLDARMRKRGIRNYMNRYSRRGNLVLDCHTDPEAADRALELLSTWADLRLGALYADLPYRDDPAKRPFHRAMLQTKDGACVYALRLDDRVIAVCVGDREGDVFITGMQGHDPTESTARAGTILVLLMARDLADRGVRCIDFTPGGQQWKERFATERREAPQVELVRSAVRARLARLGDAFREFAKRGIAATGGDAEMLRRRQRSLLQQLRRASRNGAHPRSGAWGDVLDVPLEVARVPSKSNGTPADSRASTPSALLLYDRTHDRKTTQEFLSTSRRLLESGWDPVIESSDDNLIAVSWIAPPGKAIGLHGLAGGFVPRLRKSTVSGPEDGDPIVVPDDTPLLWITTADLGTAGPSRDPGDERSRGEALTAAEAFFDKCVRAVRSRWQDADHVWVVVDSTLPGLGDVLRMRGTPVGL